MLQDAAFWIISAVVSCLLRPHFNSMKKNPPTDDDYPDHDYSDPGIRALWLMHLAGEEEEERCCLKREAAAGSKTTRPENQGRVGETDRRPSTAVAKRNSGPPGGDHPIDLRLDTSLRLRALDTLQKQLVVIRQIVS